MIVNIILDSNVYEMADCQINNDEEQIKHFNYLQNLIDFIYEKCTSSKVLLSLIEFEAIQNLQEHPWNQYESLQQYNSLPILYQKFWHIVDCYNFIDSTQTEMPTAISSIKYNSQNDALCYKEFLKHISLIKGEPQNYIVFMGTANYKLLTPLKFLLNNQFEYELNPIMDINNEDVMLFSEGVRMLLLQNRSNKPTIQKPLPNEDLCSSFLNWQNKNIIGLDKNARISLYRKVVNEVALRNGYIKDKTLSKINSNAGKIRDIYKSNSKPTIYISADIENGAIEVMDNNGKHLGEYTYLGKKNKEPDRSGKHNIKLSV